ncbi:MAG: TonB-dependent receptor, partial [Acidobacteria bacterium]|nr:TonB-dependent receptor [Acidobacteriota bacterium]
MRECGTVALIWAVLFLSLSPVVAQIGTSSFTGRVTDPTGAVAPNVNVTVVNTETNFRFVATTNEEGLFRVQSLQPGPYRVTFEIAGFKRLVRDGLILRTGDVMPVNAVLEVGTLAESVEVKGQAQLLETETSATGAIVEGSVLYKLPMYQRYVNSTLHLVPGLSSGGFTWAAGLGGYHLAGQRDGGIGIFEDGVNGNDQEGGTNTIRPIQNSVAEVKVLTTTLPAEYGHSSGGVISVVKKTGTNELHGLASNYGRSRVMSHRNFFDRYKPSQPTVVSPNGQQVFYMLPDANVGGPVVLPKIYNGRNRTFFFFGYQKMIEKKNGQYLGTVPTAEMKQGDLSFGGLGNPIYDSLTTRQLANGDWARDPYPDKRIPLSRFDPVSRKVLAMDPWKAPNQPATFTSNGPVNNLLYDQNRRAFWEDFNGRLDHQFTPNFKIYGSYTYNHQSGRYPVLTLQVCDLDVNCDQTPFTQQNYSLGKTWVINPSTVNDARVGYYRRRDDRTVGSWGKNYAQTLGIPNLSGELFPAFGTGYELSGVIGPSRKIGETLSFRDDLTKIRGAHAFKMGYELLRYRVNRWSVNQPSGSFSFTGLTGLQPSGNALPRTGNTFGGFLEGMVSSASFDLQLASWLPRSSIHSFYIQDDWKFSSALTFNLGLRYTNESPFGTKYQQMSNFDPNAPDDLVKGALGTIVHPKGALNARDNNNFQPRLGVAWHPLKKWVFRGGFAVNTVDVKFPGDQFQEYSARTVQNRLSGDPRPLYAWSRGPDPFTFLVRPDGTGPIQTTNYGSRGANWWDPKLRNPYVLNWNASIQYEMSAGYLLE